VVRSWSEPGEAVGGHAADPIKEETETYSEPEKPGDDHVVTEELERPAFARQMRARREARPAGQTSAPAATVLAVEESPQSERKARMQPPVLPTTSGGMAPAPSATPEGRKPRTGELEWGSEWKPQKTYEDETTGMSLMLNRRRRIVLWSAIGVVVAVVAVALGYRFLGGQGDGQQAAQEAGAGVEEQKKSGEEAKLKAEAEARAQEEARLKAEAERKAAEDVKLKAETERKAAQEARLKAEAEAKAQEKARLKAEAEQKAAEEARSKAEAEQKAAEEARLNAEAEQKAAEEARLKAEEERKAAAGAGALAEPVVGSKKSHKGQKSRPEGVGAEPRTGREDGSESLQGSDDSGEAKGFDGLLKKGDKLRKDGNCSAALDVYRKAMEQKPGYSEVHYKMGECYRTLGNCAEAVKYFKRAIDLSGFKNAYVFIAKCYISMGQKAEAKKYLEAGLQKYDDGIMKMMLLQVGN